MRIYGLTGGIASGKSTVAGLLRDLGARVVDADELARQVVAPSSAALADIVSHFGLDILLPSGDLDRKALGAIVFANPEERRALERITHPRIAQAGRDAMAKLAQDGEPLAFYEAALIVENGLHKAMDGLVLVMVSKEIQMERLRARDPMSKDQARSRIAAQLPLETKRDEASALIDNSGSPKATKAQVERLWHELRFYD